MAAREFIGFDVDADRVTIVLRRRTFGGLSKPSIVVVSEWRSATTPVTAALALLVARAEADELGADGRPLVELTAESALLHPELVASLTSGEATALNLPPATSLALHLDTHNLIHQADFVVRPHWVKPGGAPARVDIAGALIRQDNAWRRIPEPLYGAHQAALLLAKPLAEPDRFAALALIGKCLAGAQEGDDPISAALSSGGYLGSLRIHYASAFSLKLGSDDAFSFQPVLFGMKESEAAAEGDTLHEEADSLLAPRQQRSFTGPQGFSRPGGVRPAYALDDGAYVYLDPALRPALGVVQKFQGAPEAERKRFAADPRRIIREQLGDAAPESVERLFIETEQFSQRISGVDVWRAAVLPWIERKPNSWIPERFGIRIDEEIVPLEADEIVPLSESISAALSSNVPSVPFKDLIVPATPQTLESLNSLRDLVFPNPDDNRGEAEPSLEETLPPKAEKRFLTVAENFEDIAYSLQDRARYTPPETRLPDSVKTVLKPHQLSGFSWLVAAKAAGLPGGLLADDMGLGKTLQVLAFLAHLRETGSKTPALIVAPTGLLANWEDEIRIHLSDSALGSIHRAFGAGLRQGLGVPGRDIDRGRSGLDVDQWQGTGIVLTTYETMRDYHFSFARLPFAAIVFDEVQKLKNPTSQQTRAAKTLNGQFVIGMTGTPVENRLQDLWSIMDTVSPGLLGASKAFEARYPEDNAERLQELNKILREPSHGRPAPMIRRMKDDHLDGLPTKSVVREEIVMPPEQAKRYRLVVQRAIAARGDLSSRDGMLTALHNMRAVSLHPLPPEQAASVGDDAFVAGSARLAWTIQTLEAIKARGEKALIFLESLDLQERLAAILYRRFKMRTAPMRINGAVAGGKRQEMVRRFQTAPPGFDVMILSPKAGGVGLTLTAANHVIHLSRWWNPAVEDQSTDRVFRIGQTKPVTVYLPLAVHPDPDLRALSFDVKLNGILERKRALSRDLLAPCERGDGDINELFDAVTGAAADQTVTPATSSPLASEPVLPPSRPTLGVSTAVAPVPAPPLGWTRKEYGSGQARDLEDLFAPVKGRALRDVLISDPYVLSDASSRAALVDVIAHLYETAVPARIRVEYTPPEHMKSPGGDEDDGQQRRATGEAIALRLGGRARIELIRRRKTYERDFHDRLIQLAWDDPSGGPEKLIMDLGRGVVALRETRFDCRVNRNYA